MSRRILISTLVLTLATPACGGFTSSLRDTSPPLSGSGRADHQGDAYYHYLLGMQAQREGKLDDAVSHFGQALVFDPHAYQVMTQLALVQHQLGKPEQALLTTGKALDIAPDYVPALMEMGDLAAMSGRTAEARGWYEKVLQRDPENADAYLELARAWRREGDAAKALETLDTYETVVPSPAPTHMMLRAAIYREQKRTPEAEKVYLEILTNFAWFSPARRELIGMYLAEGGLKGTAEQLQALHVREPWHEWVPYSLIDVYTELDDHAAVERELQDLEKEKGDFETRLEVARSYARAGRWDLSDQVMATAVAWKGENGQAALLLWGQLAFAQQKYDVCLERLNLVSEGSERYVPALTQRAFALELSGKTDDAVALVEAYLKENPASTEVRFTLAALYQETKRYEAALAAFDEVLKAKPDHVEATAQKARTLQLMGKTTEAITLLQKAIQDQPEETRLHEFLAVMYSDQRRFDDAVKVLEDALQYRPEDFDLRYQYGGALDSAGRKQEGLAQMRVLLEIDPENSDVLNFVGYTYAEMGIRLSEAELYIRKALEADPDNGYIIDSLGWVYYKQAEYKKAAESLEKAVTLTGDEAVIIEHLADTYVKLDLKREALYLYRRALRVAEPDPQSAPADLERLRKKIGDLEAKKIEAKRPDMLGE